jgi:hypothetical protein
MILNNVSSQHFFFYWCLYSGLFLTREYWIIYRGLGFLTVVWFGSYPTFSPSPISKPNRRYADRLEREMELANGRGVSGWGRSQIIQRRESLVLYKSLIPPDLNISCFPCEILYLYILPLNCDTQKRTHWNVWSTYGLLTFQNQLFRLQIF